MNKTCAEQHARLVCTRCGASADFDDSQIRELQLHVARRHGFRVDGCRLDLFGRCLRCRSSGGARALA